MLHVACIFEMLTGDGRYSNHTKQLVAVDPNGQEFRTNTVELALHLAACMRINATGGVPCEPGLVFIQCNNHPFCGLTLLEGLGYFPPGFFDPERERFQHFVCGAMRASIQTGALRIMAVTTKQHTAEFDAVYCHERLELDLRLQQQQTRKRPLRKPRRNSRSSSPSTSPAGRDTRTRPGVVSSPSRVSGSVPFAHLGSDAWDLAYFWAWTTNPNAVTHMYQHFVRDKIQVLREKGAWFVDGNGTGGARSQPPAEWNSPPTSHCCLGLNIPKSAWTTALMPVCTFLCCPVTSFCLLKLVHLAFCH